MSYKKHIFNLLIAFNKDLYIFVRHKTKVAQVLTGAALFFWVMLEVYTFREIHNTVKKQGLYNIPLTTNQGRATSRHDDFPTSHYLFVEHGSVRGLKCLLESYSIRGKINTVLNIF